MYGLGWTTVLKGSFFGFFGIFGFVVGSFAIFGFVLAVLFGRWRGALFLLFLLFLLLLLLFFLFLVLLDPILNFFFLIFLFNNLHLSILFLFASLRQNYINSYLPLSILLLNFLLLTCFSMAVFFLGIFAPVNLQNKNLGLSLCGVRNYSYSDRSICPSIPFLYDLDLR